MDDDDLESELVPDPCPHCCEARVDCLVWQDEPCKTAVESLSEQQNAAAAKIPDENA